MEKHLHPISDIHKLARELYAGKTHLKKIEAALTAANKLWFEQDCQLSDFNRRIDRLEQNKCC